MPVLQVFHLGLHETALVTRGQVVHRGHAKEVALMDDDHARPKLRRLDHFLESFFSFLLSSLAVSLPRFNAAASAEPAVYA